MNFEISGTDQIVKVLKQAGPKHSRNLMRATVHGVAGRVTKLAKKNTPKATGNLRKSLYTKRKKSAPYRPVSDVRVRRGKNNRYDGFYWRFVEFGTVNQRARPYIGPAAETIRKQYQSILAEEFGKKLTKALEREARKLGKR